MLWGFKETTRGNCEKELNNLENKGEGVILREEELENRIRL